MDWKTLSGIGRWFGGELKGYLLDIYTTGRLCATDDGFVSLESIQSIRLIFDFIITNMILIYNESLSAQNEFYRFNDLRA